MTVPMVQDADRETVSRRMGSGATRILVLVLFIGLTVGMTWPLVLNLRDAVPGPPWDNFVWLYDLWHFRHSIVDLGQWPTLNESIFVPFGYDLRLSETMLANKLLIAPVLFWGDEVLAYNILLLLTFVLTGYTTYLLIAYLTDNRYAAVIGGAIFAFSPYRMHAMAAGWLPLLATQWIPLVFLYMERMLREAKVRHALALGLFMSLTLLSSWYYLYVVGSMAFIYLLIRLRPWKESFRQFELWRNLLWAGAVMVALVGPVALPVIFSHTGSMGWSLSEVQKWAASADDFILPNVYHPVWGDFFLTMRAETLRYPWYAPGFVYLGILPLILAIAAVFKKDEQDRVSHPMAWVWLISLVLGLGLVLHWQNEIVTIKVPSQVENWVSRAMSSMMSKWALNKASYYDIKLVMGTIPVPLPAMLVYLFLPLGNAMRTLYRFGAMTLLATTVMASISLARLLGGARFPRAAGGVGLSDASDTEYLVASSAKPGRSGARSLLLCILFLLVVLVDFCSAPLAYGFSDVKPQPLDRWIASRPDDAVIMQFPLVRALSGDTLYRTKYHGRRVAYGHGTFYPQAYLEAMPTLATFPSRESLDLLDSWGVTYVIVGSQVYDAGWGDQKGQTWKQVESQIEASGRLVFLGVSNDEPLWRDERVSKIIQGSPPVEPILVDKVYVYELK